MQFSTNGRLHWNNSLDWLHMYAFHGEMGKIQIKQLEIPNPMCPHNSENDKALYGN